MEIAQTETPWWIEKLASLGACQEGLKHCHQFSSWDDFWARSKRGDYLLWAAAALSGSRESPARRLMVRAACSIVETRIRGESPGGGTWALLYIIRAWTRGEVPFAKVMESRRAVRVYAAYAAVAAASAACASSPYAAAVASAGVFADVAEDADGACEQRDSLRLSADIVRGYYPVAPDLFSGEEK